MYKCSDCKNAFEEADTTFDRWTDFVVERCPYCGSKAFREIDVEDRYRKYETEDIICD